MFSELGGAGVGRSGGEDPVTDKSILASFVAIA